MEELALTYANLILDNRFRPRIDPDSRRRAIYIYIYTQWILLSPKNAFLYLKKKKKRLSISFEFDTF